VPRIAHRDQPLTERVSSQLRERVGAGTTEAGQYLASERELCRELGVSRFTVRSALRTLVAEGLLERRASKGYQVRGAGELAGAPALAGGNGGAVVFLHSHPEAELLAGYHARMWAGARLEAARLGVRVVVCSVQGEEASPAKAAEIRALAGAVICDHHDERWVSELLAAGLRLVMIDHVSLEGRARGLDAVIQDDVGGIRLALEHLAGRGHRRVGYVDYSPLVEPKLRGNASRRLGAFLGEGRRLGLDPAPALVAAARPEAADAPEPIEGLLDAGATALVLPSRHVFAGAFAALERRGVRAGGDFGLVVWGDPAAGESEAGFPTSITWSKEQMGREAVRRLVLDAARPEAAPATVEIPATLVDRGTGGRGPGGSRG
jgi:DNA-binding LacI/PurR family transcriptional regulator